MEIHDGAWQMLLATSLTFNTLHSTLNAQHCYWTIVSLSQTASYDAASGIWWALGRGGGDPAAAGVPPHGAPRRRMARCRQGRGVHSSTSQLNLGSFAGMSLPRGGQVPIIGGSVAR